MRWEGNYPYVGRQPPTVRGSVRKRGAAVSGDGRTRLYERNSQNVPYAQTDYLMHRDDSSQSLAHFGIPGMKWGLRRYQNPDGTLTEEGKKRYGRDDSPESETWKRSDAEHLSDEELRRRNTRLQAEQQYRNLTTSEVERERNQFAKGIKQDAIRKILIGGAVALAATAMRKNYAKVGPLVSKYSKVLMSKIKSSKWLKGGLLKNSRRYMSPTGPANAGKVVGENDTLVRNLRNKFNPHTFNYRPRINNALPKSQNWPNIPNYFKKKA